MAKFKNVVVEKDGVQRVATSPSELVSFQWDGFVEAEQAEPAKVPSGKQAGGSKSSGDTDPKTAGSNG